MKKLIATALAVVMSLGIAALPMENSGLFSGDKAITASAETYDNYEYKILDDGTVEITDYTGSETDLTIPSTIDGKKVTSIGDDAFYRKQMLTSVNVPDSVTKIGGWSFWYCPRLENVTLGSNVKEIGDRAFGFCSILRNINLPDGLVSINESAFTNCRFLYSIIIPDSVINIEKNLFSECKFLRKVKIGNGVKSINEWAFSDCINLENVTLGSNLEVIKQGAFDGCSNLTSVTIPNSITSIENLAFYNCPNLKDVYYAGSEEDWNKININANNEELTEATIHYDHAHSYSNEVTKQPTCTETGIKTYTCVCGDSYTETIPATGHKYSTEWIIDKEATETEEGLKSHHCTICDAKTDITVIPKLENNDSSSNEEGEIVLGNSMLKGQKKSGTYTYRSYINVTANILNQCTSGYIQVQRYVNGKLVSTQKLTKCYNQYKSGSKKVVAPSGSYYLFAEPITVKSTDRLVDVYSIQGYSTERFGAILNKGTTDNSFTVG